jgi:hypothetical protein
MHADRLKVKQTSTGYWIVQRGVVELTGAMTQRAAEAECELRNRLRDRATRRSRGARGSYAVTGASTAQMS